jgi:hypothetical protein
MALPPALRQGRPSAAWSRCAALLLLCCATLGRAQSHGGPEYRLGGWIGLASTSVRWTIAPQLVAVPPSNSDSFALSRGVQSPSLSLGIGGTRYGSSHLGVTIEGSYLQLWTTATCAPLGAYAPDPAHTNETTCGDIDGKRLRLDIVSLQAGLAWRSGSRGPAQAYVRVLAGGEYVARSFVQTEGVYLRPLTSDTNGLIVKYRVVFLEEQQPHTLTWTASVAAGVTFALGSATDVVLQAGDALLRLAVPTSPGDPSRDPQRVRPLAPARWRTLHATSFRIGIETVMGRAPTRRY